MVDLHLELPGSPGTPSIPRDDYDDTALTTKMMKDSRYHMDEDDIEDLRYVWDDKKFRLKRRNNLKPKRMI